MNVVDAPERVWVGPDGYWVNSEKTGHHHTQYVRADIYARLQEQVERLEADLRDYRNGMDSARKDFFTATTKLVASEARAEAAEAERDRLREAQTRVTDLLDSYETRFAPRHTIPEREIGILDTCQNIRMAIAETHDPAALQKEPQPPAQERDDGR